MIWLDAEPMPHRVNRRTTSTTYISPPPLLYSAHNTPPLPLRGVKPLTKKVIGTQSMVFASRRAAGRHQGSTPACQRSGDAKPVIEIAQRRKIPPPVCRPDHGLIAVPRTAAQDVAA